MKQTKLIISMIVLVILIGVVLLFSLKKRPEQQSSQKESIKIGVIVYPGFGLMYIPQEKGYFTEEGVDVEIVQIADENQLASSLASNNVQMIISTSGTTTIFADAGIDAPQIFATSIGYGSDGLVVKDDINDFADLKGKQIHLSLGTPSHFLFRYLIEEKGLRVEDFEFINGTADQIGAGFVAGQIDYGMTWEPWLSKAAEREDGKVLITSRGVPEIITDTIVARRDLIEKRREDVKAVMRAFFKGVDFWKSNPTEANSIIAKNFNITLKEFEPMMATVKPLDYNGNLAKFNRANEFNLFELTGKAIDFYFADGIIQTKLEADDLVDPSLLEELYQ